MSTVYYYKVYCETESIYVYKWDTITPTTCPNNNTHTINNTSISILSSIQKNKVIVSEEDTPTGEHYKSVSYKISAPVGVSNHDYTFPYPVSALAISFNTISDNIDDELEVIVGPDITVGSITADVNASDTVITVSSSVIDYIELGFYVQIDDGTNIDDLGVVTSIDKNNLTITVETAATQSFAASTPTYVKMSVKVIDNFIFGPSGRYVLGDSKIGGSYVPTNTVVRVKYINNGGSTTDFYPVIEYLY